MNQVFAYLDAGSGSMILQMLIGGVAGVAALARYRWNRFRARSTSTEPSETSTTASEEEPSPTS